MTLLKLECLRVGRRRGRDDAAVDDGFAAAFSKVEQALELAPLDHAEAMGLESWEVGANSGTIAGYKGRKVGLLIACLRLRYVQIFVLYELCCKWYMLGLLYAAPVIAGLLLLGTLVLSGYTYVVFTAGPSCTTVACQNYRNTALCSQNKKRKQRQWFARELQAALLAPPPLPLFRIPSMCLSSSLTFYWTRIHLTYVRHTWCLVRPTGMSCVAFSLAFMSHPYVYFFTYFTLLRHHVYMSRMTLVLLVILVPRSLGISHVPAFTGVWSHAPPPPSLVRSLA